MGQISSTDQCVAKQPHQMFFSQNKALLRMSRKESGLRCHGGSAPSGGIACPAKACPVGLYQGFCFRSSCAGLSAEARCNSWTWAATRPLAGNPSGMVCKLWLHGKPWQVQKGQRRGHVREEPRGQCDVGMEYKTSQHCVHLQGRLCACSALPLGSAACFKEGLSSSGSS